MMSERHTLTYGDTPITFDIERRERRTLAISVTPGMTVEVVAPHEAPEERIFEKVRKRAPWILKQLRYFSQFQPRTPNRRYVSGETHLYLGRRYKLKVVPHVQQEIKLVRGCIVVQSHWPKEPERTREIIEEWYRARAKVKFRERLEICQELFPNPEAFEPKGLIVRALRQRWGSMTANGNLVLNRALISTSVDAIDYVITHELCHIRYAHHGAGFYKLLDRVMPDWEKRKIKLERQLA